MSVEPISFERRGTLSPETYEMRDFNGNLIAAGSNAAVAYECGECGALTAQTALHESWHGAAAPSTEQEE